MQSHFRPAAEMAAYYSPKWIVHGDAGWCRHATTTMDPAVDAAPWLTSSPLWARCPEDGSVDSKALPSPCLLSCVDLAHLGEDNVTRLNRIWHELNPIVRCFCLLKDLMND